MKLKSKTYSVSYEELAEQLLLKGKVLGVEKGEQCLYITTAYDKDKETQYTKEFLEWAAQEEAWLDEIDVLIWEMENE